MFSMWAHALWARVCAVALATPLLFAGVAPVLAGHPMTPAFGSDSQVDYVDDFQADAGGLPTLGCLHSVPIGCFGADTIRPAYGIPAANDPTVNGTGRTIVIIDAFQNPHIQTDLTHFDGFWNLPHTSLTVLSPFGDPGFDPTKKIQRGFSVEISIDVEWAHAMAPGAALVLVQAISANDVDLVAALKYAIDNNLGDVITQSFGEAESCIDPVVLADQHAALEKASSLGITVLASSGDQGGARQSCDGTPTLVAGPSTPASDPEVTSVGGTRLMADSSGAYMSESVWNTPKTPKQLTGEGASGGGFSTLYRRPGYQAPFQKNNKARGVPDVAYNADKATGYVVWWMGMGAVVGGTSAGSPQWAGIIALADQAAGRRMGATNK